ncbi:MAG: diaminopimelate decarboxylase, partial [Firmicutes bacterium]|nr:diaminopimelate decarboxylase [Bacillota bacterium]
SGGELYTAISAGYPAEHIYFHGNNKTAAEIDFALRVGIARFITDNMDELLLVDRIAREKNRVAEVILRLTPGIEAHTHEYVKTGQIDSKFGIGIPNGEALRAVEAAMQLPNIRLTGIHCHIGSQIFEIEPFQVAVNVMMDFAAEARAKCGFVMEELNLGGGLGIKYNRDDKPTTAAALAQACMGAVREAASQRDLPLPKLLLEPGRSIVGEAGTTLYTVGGVKEIPGIRTYISVDGGMADNPRVALYQARYEATIANKASMPMQELVSVAGNCCESGDMLIWNITLPHVEVGDILAVFCTGAYNYSMASNYNRYPRPAAVFVRDGQADLVIRRETYEDLVRKDVVPARLACRRADSARRPGCRTEALVVGESPNQ